MDKYICSFCGYVYDPTKGDPENGVAPLTKLEDVYCDWTCPICSASKDEFVNE